MKKILLTFSALAVGITAASAADLPVKAPPPPLPVPNWTGCYVGVNGGGIWTQTRADPDGFVSNGFVAFDRRELEGEFPSFKLSSSGATAGGQFGCNYQPIGTPWVAGFETDLNWTDIKRTETFFFPATAAFQANTQSAFSNLPWLGTVRGRVGYLWVPTVLLYATAGIAYGRVEQGVATVGVPNGFPGVGVAVSSSSVRAGWTIGAGMEWAFAPSWSLKFEYLYFDLGNSVRTLSFAGLGGGAVGNAINYNFSEWGQLARVGVNYRFNLGGPY
jgi:outer membrane immunogenic protein